MTAEVIKDVNQNPAKYKAAKWADGAGVAKSMLDVSVFEREDLLSREDWSDAYPRWLDMIAEGGGKAVCNASVVAVFRRHFELLQREDEIKECIEAYFGEHTH